MSRGVAVMLPELKELATLLPDRERHTGAGRNAAEVFAAILCRVQQHSGVSPQLRPIGATSPLDRQAIQYAAAGQRVRSIDRT